MVLAVAVDTWFGESSHQGSVAFAVPADYDEDGELLVRRVDLIESVERFERSDDFEIGEDGRTIGILDAVLDERRTMRVAPGTPGVITCRNLVGVDRCVVLADMLGDAVVWFAILPKAPSETVELPSIVDLQDGYALFENGWEVRYPPVIERVCADQDIPSFSDFLRRFGPGSTTVVDLDTQQVLRVECDLDFVAPTTTVVWEGSLDASIVTVAPTSTEPVLDPDVQAPEN